MAVTPLYACLNAQEPAQNWSQIKEQRIKKEVYKALNAIGNLCERLFTQRN